MSDNYAPGRRRSEGEIQRAVWATLGPEGRMISLSKTDYSSRHPSHVVVFNGNVLVGGIKRWYGDFDATRDEHLLVELARRTGEVVSLLFEHDARFATRAEPRVARAVYSVTPDGVTVFADSRMVRDKRGRLVLRRYRDRA